MPLQSATASPTMVAMDSGAPAVDASGKPVKKKLSWVNLALGAGLNMFEVSTLGQPFGRR